MTLFVVVVIFQKIYYIIYNYCFQNQGAKSKIIVLVIFFIVVIGILATCIGLTVAVLIALPINNAIDLASTEIYAIYQASVTLFAALVTFQVVFQPTNSILAVLIKAADERVSGGNQQNKIKPEEWKEKSEKEKETHLGNQILSFIKFDDQIDRNGTN